MGYKVSFLDNQVCGVDDFNAILGDVVQEGVVTNDFAKTSAYQMSKMNVVVKDAVSQGVAKSEKSLACTVGVGGVYVAPGVGIFGSGAKIKVTESEFLAVENVENTCVYAYHDMKNNMAGLKSASDGFPAEVEGEFYVLPLCRIIDGVISDKREYAKAKLRVCDTYNTVQKKVLTSPDRSYDGTEIEIDTDGDRINFLVFCSYGNEVISVVTEPEHGVFEIESTSSDARVYLFHDSRSCYLSDFQRDTEGKVLATVHSEASGSYQYVLYTSVYEEVIE